MRSGFSARGFEEGAREAVVAAVSAVPGLRDRPPAAAAAAAQAAKAAAAAAVPDGPRRETLNVRVRVSRI